MAKGYKVTIKDRSSGKNVMAFNVTRTPTKAKKTRVTKKKDSQGGLGALKLTADWFK